MDSPMRRNTSGLVSPAYPVVCLGQTELKDLNGHTAVEYFESSLKIRPGNALAYNGIGRANEFLKRYDEAERYYQKAIDADPVFR